MDTTAAKVQALGDLELAVLLCLVAQQHCIISTQNLLLDNLAQELKLIAANIFGLTCALVNCSAATTLDDFKQSVLVDVQDPLDGHAASSTHLSLPSFKHTGSRQTFFRNQSGTSNELDERKIADIIIAKDLNMANSNVQTQALELIRTKRLFSHTAMHGTSKNFLFVALQASESKSRLGFHLNDMFAISHYHSEEDGFPNLEEQHFQEPPPSDDAVSISSVVKHPIPDQDALRSFPVISPDEVQTLRAAVKDVRVSAEVASYLHNIVIFMRLNRFVAGGISAYATRHFRAIVYALAPLHDLTYAPPSLVALAARKVYAHRLVLATSNTERSMQWGSDYRAVEQVLQGVTVEDAIESVLSSVEAPL
ncbi:hypothetical protein D6D20_01601 [Aureobasidium pullulans]|uniref:Magnesium chelatase n=1 Tax=Aureobasidium pullulans TaxID=5580 RepID=A0A4S8ZJL0_AURPU|nr:hypothetical protein D6D20_01601 [Aureobasidium pullulans]